IDFRSAPCAGGDSNQTPSGPGHQRGSPSRGASTARISPDAAVFGARLQRRYLEEKAASGAAAKEAAQAKLAKVNAHPRRLLQIQENYAMDAVQRDLNLILTQDQIDNGGLFIYTTLDPNVQSTAQQALETQLTKI